MVRRLKEQEHPLVIVLHFQIIGIIAGFIYVLFDFKMPQGIDWVYLLMTGILTQYGQIYLTKALQSERVAQVSIINYAGILYALIFGWLIFGEIYTIQTILGIALVISGVVLSIIYGKKRIEIVDENTVG